MDTVKKKALFYLVISTILLSTILYQLEVFYQIDKRLPDPCHLRLPLYYSDNAVFQIGPTSHTVWGLVQDKHCPIEVTETCPETNTRGERNEKLV